MINGLHQYSTESLIKELEKRGYDCDNLEKMPAREISEPVAEKVYYSYVQDPQNIRSLSYVDQLKKELEDEDYRKRVGILFNPYSNK